MIKWSEKEREAFTPPERLTVSDWADQNIILDSRLSAFPGPWRTDRTPYLKEPMNCYNDAYLEEIVSCFGTQSGKTSLMFNVMAYIAAQDPNPALVVYPTLALAEFTSENRIQPIIELCTALKDKYLPDESKRLELQFTGMYLTLSGANSPASLASRPVRYLFCDETDKFPDASKKEADPISLAEERTKTFYNRKKFKSSTPTLERGYIWKDLLSCDVIKQFYVPCPHCGHRQTFKLKGIKWPDALNDFRDDERIRRVKDLAWYECESCKGIIEDKHKSAILKSGEWRPVRYTQDGEWEPAHYPESKIRKVGYHLNSIFSPWVTFGEVAAQFLAAKDFPDKLRNFINSWLAEPWRDKSRMAKSDEVLKRQSNHEQGRVPQEAQILTAAVDVQLDHFWWEVRAWGPNFTSWLVDYGRAETWNHIEKMLDREYISVYGEPRIINLCLIDSGFRTDEVYDFCTMRAEVCKPSKGSSSGKKMTALYRVIKAAKEGYEGLLVYEINTDYFKTFIHSRMKRPTDSPGSWNLFGGCPQEYADHITSEEHIEEVDSKTGFVKEYWKPIGSHPMNHLFDCAVGTACAAELMGVRYLQEEMESEEPREKPKTQSESSRDTKDGWVPERQWFRR